MAKNSWVYCFRPIQLHLFRTRAEISVAFRSAKAAYFRGAKGDNPTDIDSPVLTYLLQVFLFALIDTFPEDL